MKFLNIFSMILIFISQLNAKECPGALSCKFLDFRYSEKDIDYKNLKLEIYCDRAALLNFERNFLFVTDEFYSDLSNSGNLQYFYRTRLSWDYPVYGAGGKGGGIINNIYDHSYFYTIEKIHLDFISKGIFTGEVIIHTPHGIHNRAYADLPHSIKCNQINKDELSDEFKDFLNNERE